MKLTDRLSQDSASLVPVTLRGGGVNVGSAILRSANGTLRKSAGCQGAAPKRNSIAQPAHSLFHHYTALRAAVAGRRRHEAQRAPERGGVRSSKCAQHNTVPLSYPRARPHAYTTTTRASVDRETGKGGGKEERRSKQTNKGKNSSSST